MGTRKVEFTIGVCVPVTLDDDDDNVVGVGRLRRTEGGLFSDACDGAWSPDSGEWVEVVDAARNRAVGIVGKLIAAGNARGAS